MISILLSNIHIFSYNKMFIVKIISKHLTMLSIISRKRFNNYNKINRVTKLFLL